VEQTEAEKEALQAEVKDLDEALDDLRQQIIDRNLMIEGREAAVNVEKSKVSETENTPAVSPEATPLPCTNLDGPVSHLCGFKGNELLPRFPRARLKRCESR
jgi:hypothetical protein